MFINNLGNRFHISVFLAVVLKAELGMATVLLFYILPPPPPKVTLTQYEYASFSKLYYSTATKFQSPISRGPSLAVITHVLAFVVLLVIVGKITMFDRSHPVVFCDNIVL